MRAFAIVVVGLLVGGCASSGTPISGDSRNVGNVTMTFRIEPSKVRRGGAVRMTVNLQNISGQPQQLTFSSSQRYDFWVTRNGRDVWRWSASRSFLQAISNEELPGQSGRRYEEVWQTQDPGTFTAHAIVTAPGFDTPLSGEVTVE